MLNFLPKLFLNQIQLETLMKTLDQLRAIAASHSAEISYCLSLKPKVFSRELSREEDEALTQAYAVLETFSKNSLSWSSEELEERIDQLVFAFDTINVAIIRPKIGSAIAKGATELSLDELHITRLPMQLLSEPRYEAFWKNLTHISIDKNNLSFLPININVCTKLEMLSLHQNHITELPDSITKFNKLHTLDISSNNLHFLPPSLGGLVNLQTLYASDNFIQELPQSMKDLKHLTKLYLSNNRLTTMPLFLGNLAALNLVRVDHNFLLTMPFSLQGKLCGASITAVLAEQNQPTQKQESSNLYLVQYPNTTSTMSSSKSRVSYQSPTPKP